MFIPRGEGAHDASRGTMSRRRDDARVRSVVAARPSLPEMRVHFRRRHALPLVDHGVPALARRAGGTCRDVVRAARRLRHREFARVGADGVRRSLSRRIRTRTTCSGPRGSFSARISSRSGCCSWSSRSISSRPPMDRDRPHWAPAVRERVIEPSAALIAGYDEGLSNRQVWNNAALLAASRIVGGRVDEVGAARAVRSRRSLKERPARRWDMVRGRELPPFRPSRSLVRRDDRHGSRRRTRYCSGRPVQ